MNDQELLAEIKRLHEEDKIDEDLIAKDGFIEHPQYHDLHQSFQNSNYVKYDKQLKWHQLVRLALEPPKKREYLYHRLLDLLQQFRHEDDYFIFKTEDTLYQIPDMLSNLNKLKILYQKYFQIYRNILNQIHFDYPKEKQIGRIEGRINWSETIRNNPVEFPMNFVTSVSKKVFETPENILLVLCARWMYKESSRLLKANFTDPLNDSNKKILFDILEKTEFITKTFPFRSVIINSEPFRDVPYSSPNSKLKKN